MTSYNLALIGCGKMGQALAHGWISSGIAGHIDIVEPQDVPLSGPVTHVKAAKDLKPANGTWDAVILAVKPQVMNAACATLANILPADQLILSIAAGRTLSSLHPFFPDALLVRAMPNTPAAIGKGMTVLCALENVTDTQKEIADDLLSATGQTAWVKEEILMDAVTALSGSGPAYVFYLVEAMAEAGRKAGLDKDFALGLARQTVIGSAALLESESDIDAATLRQNVTSPGGTTEAALKILMKGDFQRLMDEAIAAATNRGRELAE